MKYSKIILLLVCFSLLFSFIVRAEDPCSDKDPHVDEWIHCDDEPESESDEDETAQIDPEDCSVTCTDEQTGIEHTISAYGKAYMYDDGDDTVYLDYGFYYSNSLDEEYEFYHGGVGETQGAQRRGVVGRFFPWYDEDRELESYYDLGDVAYTIIDVYSKRSFSPFFPLLFQSSSVFTQSGNTITHSYSHNINYDPCPGKYIELYVCADDGTNYPNNPCLYSSDTALVDCLIHDNGEVTHIRDLDTEGTQQTCWDGDSAYEKKGRGNEEYVGC